MLEIDLAPLIDVETDGSDILAEAQGVIFAEMGLEPRLGIDQHSLGDHQLSRFFLLLLRHNQIVLLVDVHVSSGFGRSHRDLYSLLLRGVSEQLGCCQPEEEAEQDNERFHFVADQNGWTCPGIYIL